MRRIVYLGGFVPDDPDGALSEHLTSRAEVAQALTIDGGPEVVWLGAALIFGAGSTSFEMLRYVGDRFPVIPIPAWMDNPIDPISIRDVLHYLVAAADAGQVPAGAYDISGPDTTSYRALLKTYARISGKWHTGLPAWGGHHAGVMGYGGGAAGARRTGRRFGRVAGSSDAGQPAPDCVIWFPILPAGCFQSRTRSAGRCRTAGRVRSTRSRTPTTWPTAIRRGPAAMRCGCGGLRAIVTPSIARPGLGLMDVVPGPIAGALRTGLDILITLTPKVRFE